MRLLFLTLATGVLTGCVVNTELYRDRQVVLDADDDDVFAYGAIYMYTGNETLPEIGLDNAVWGLMGEVGVFPRYDRDACDNLGYNQEPAWWLDGGADPELDFEAFDLAREGDRYAGPIDRADLDEEERLDLGPTDVGGSMGVVELLNAAVLPTLIELESPTPSIPFDIDYPFIEWEPNPADDYVALSVAEVAPDTQEAWFVNCRNVENDGEIELDLSSLPLTSGHELQLFIGSKRVTYSELPNTALSRVDSTHSTVFIYPVP